MDAIYGGGPSVSGNPNGLAGLPHTDASRAHPPRLPRNLPSRIPGPFQSTSSAARNRLRVLIAQREEEGDGDLFAFCGPQPRADIDGPGNSKPRRKRKRKEDVTEVNVE
ncbi:hypothetical protein EW145_g6379 [Phellinidium pouzarii]|uniref:Uncharacterized protein n=1 Tax=Phellinidium pouzarii TaxID=167371 RepID=A0A4S4KWR1_9AGAM|nr:hypothetical protein EW145_g6379 [Phellinidium pouzarii]